MTDARKLIATRAICGLADGVVSVALGFSNGPVEGLNGKIRTITRRAYGFHDAANLIAFIFG
jgi:transposase